MKPENIAIFDLLSARRMQGFPVAAGGSDGAARFLRLTRRAVSTGTESSVNAAGEIKIPRANHLRGN
ncbi:hypothetical protein [Burkholderia cenocepacia]|uniref:hypothetical protein n=1 Tax=Burkholderia cenocepacia TaxID=95486 RepID=UPI000F5A8EE4|nr:hypothetical protein [Burkholderia cenocepacia]